MVSGTAALLVDIDRDINGAMAVKDLSHATAVGQELGAGELDAYQACLAAKQKGN
jgi:hypothetical protein